MSFFEGFLVGGLVVFGVGVWVHSKPTKAAKAAKVVGPNLHKTNPRIERPYFIYPHIRPDSFYNSGSKYESLKVCGDCYATGDVVEMHYASACPKCGGKLLSEDVSGRWLKREGRWLLSEHSYYPYPKIDITMKDITNVATQIRLEEDERQCRPKIRNQSH